LIKIHNLDTAINRGTERLFDLAAVKLQNATRILREDLATDFFAETYDGDDKMVGLQAITSNSGTVGGINKANYSWWRGYYDVPGSARDLAFRILNSAYFDTKKYGGGDPATVIVTSEGVLQKYEDNLTKVHTEGGSTGDVPLVQILAQSAERGPRRIDGGFEAFYFKRIE